MILEEFYLTISDFVVVNPIGNTEINEYLRIFAEKTEYSTRFIYIIIYKHVKGQQLIDILKTKYTIIPIYAKILRSID